MLASAALAEILMQFHTRTGSGRGFGGRLKVAGHSRAPPHPPVGEEQHYKRSPTLKRHLQAVEAFRPGNKADDAVPLGPGEVGAVGGEGHRPGLAARLLVERGRGHQEFADELGLICKNRGQRLAGRGRADPGEGQVSQPAPPRTIQVGPSMEEAPDWLLPQEEAPDWLLLLAPPHKNRKRSERDHVTRPNN